MHRLDDQNKDRSARDSVPLSTSVRDKIQGRQLSSQELIYTLKFVKEELKEVDKQVTALHRKLKQCYKETLQNRDDLLVDLKDIKKSRNEAVSKAVGLSMGTLLPVPMKLYLAVPVAIVFADVAKGMLI